MGRGNDGTGRYILYTDHEKEYRTVSIPTSTLLKDPKSARSGGSLVIAEHHGRDQPGDNAVHKVIRLNLVIHSIGITLKTYRVNKNWRAIYNGQNKERDQQ